MESEKSFSNRNAVRLKSAKFIEKAEQIYRNYLRYDNAPLFDTRNIPRDVSNFLSFNHLKKREMQYVGSLNDWLYIFLIVEWGWIRFPFL